MIFEYRTRNVHSMSLLKDDISELAQNFVAGLSSKLAKKFKLSEDDVEAFLSETKTSRAKKGGKKSSAPPKKGVKAQAKNDKKDSKLVPQVENMKITLKRNKYMNFEHPETHFVFNENKEVIGKQVGENVEPLTVKDIQECGVRKFPYKMPILLRDDEEDEKSDVSDVEGSESE